MAKSLLCDRCGSVIGDITLANGTMQDLVINVCGHTVACFDDLCEACSDDIIQQVALIVPGAFDAMAEEIQEEFEQKIEEEAYQEAIDEGLVEVATIDEMPEEFLENIEGYVPGKFAAFDTAENREAKKNTGRDIEDVVLPPRPPLELDENTGLFC